MPPPSPPGRPLPHADDLPTAQDPSRDHGHDQGHDHGHGHDRGHDHGHAHGHAHAVGSSRRALALSLGLNAAFLLIEAGVGFSTGSLALLSDAAHMLSDVGALVLALGATWLAARPADRALTFGFRRAEVMGGFINGIALLGACAGIAWEAVGRLHAPPQVPGLPVLIVGFGGLLINLGSAWVLARADRGDLNIRGALIHMLADALGSVGAMIAAVLMMAGYPAADAIVSLLIAGLVLWGTWGLLRDSSRVLLQFPPAGFDVGAMCVALAGIQGVESVHDAHVWTLDGRSAIVSAHVVARPGADLETVRACAVAWLEEHFSVRHATLQVEGAQAPPCHVADCTPAVRTQG